ncbi:rplQ [Wigglesworthia glossinidia endosymbiont of Glossina brevipalpis]|uniref:Large ribosomal subunit protein bL17 n=1 Tax=Wigglesworthia glossinidia brevipalpis TaxID=36870 RepID=RL17_WIGBR|nr:RecName: Full=Large ribosomal subunit protein bL17; AltName: Full=50S ribosomal protein L17 [Wigglesworthia glossinidia endosymbiont of Glossina brevipalpis]BAC24715.1 rplQ [Wigglesworthia glossinidia endosymbiont of Glossina brevipalpis]
MRHRNTGRYLGRNSSHRDSMLKNMIISLIRYEIIHTTLQKAKELRKILEPLITISKINSISNRRNIYSKIRNNEIIHKLFNDIGPRFLKKNGGYLSILKSGYRKGDNAYMAYIKFTNTKKNI